MWRFVRFAVALGLVGLVAGAVGWWVRGELESGPPPLSIHAFEGDAVRYVAHERGLEPGFEVAADFHGSYCGAVVTITAGGLPTFVVVGEDSGDPISRFPSENTAEAAVRDLYRDTRC